MFVISCIRFQIICVKEMGNLLAIDLIPVAALIE